MENENLNKRKLTRKREYLNSGNESLLTGFSTVEKIRLRKQYQLRSRRKTDG